MSAGATAAAERERRLAPTVLAVLALALCVWLIAGLPAEPHSHAFHDELHYAQTARDFAAGHLPRYNRVYQPLVPPLYGLVQAPARALAGQWRWEWWSRALNAVLVTAALAPLYGLARRLLRPGWAAAAALLAVTGASLVFVRYLLSESLFLLLFPWLALAVVRACERPTLARGLELGLVAGLCYLARSIVVVSLPAAVLAIAWAARSPARVARASVGFGLGMALLVLPWALRGRLFPEEGALDAAFSYMGGLRAGGLQTIGTYAEWIWRTFTSALIGVGPALLALGLVGLWQALVAREPGRRGLGLFVLLSAGATLGLVSVASVQWGAIGRFKIHERYLMPFWGIVAIAGIAALRSPRVPRVPLALASALVLAAIATVPVDCFDGISPQVNPLDFPTSPLAQWIAREAGSPGGARLVYLALFAPMLLVARRPRAAAAAVVALAALYQGAAVMLALRGADRQNQWAEGTYRPVWDWLDPIVRDGDLILHHRLSANIAYQNALRYEMEHCQLQDDLVPLISATVRLDKATGRFRLVPGARQPERTWILTEVPGLPVPGEIRHEGLRLIPVDDGLAPLGAWLGEARESPSVVGRAADGLCDDEVRIRLAGSYPCQAELAAAVTLAGAGPDAAPLGVRLSCEGRVVTDGLVPPRATWLFSVARKMWAPELSVTLAARRDGPAGPRFTMSEPTQAFGAWRPANAVRPAADVAVSGVGADLWCERRVALRLSVGAEPLRFSLVLAHPEGSPVAGPLGVAVSVGGRRVTRIELAPGATHTLLVCADSDGPGLDLALEADRDGLLDGRRVAFRLGAR